VALQREIGPEFYTKILEPVLRSEARRVFGRYTPEEIYSTKREIVEREIREGLGTIGIVSARLITSATAE
jgi:hypothetical protein